MSTAPLRVDRIEPGVALLTLDVPERRNAMTEALTAAWTDVVRRLEDDGSLRCVVVTGAGSAFCSGGDLSWIESGGDLALDVIRGRMASFYRSWLSVRNLPVPTIAAVNGPAVGAGLALALACDLRYAVPDATFSAPFTALGIHPGMATTWLLPEVAGLPLAREMLLAGRVLDGDEAARAGVVNRTFPREGFLDQVMDVARAVASAAPLATRLTKQALAAGGHTSVDAALAWELLAQPVTMGSADLREGLRARRERRPPRFTGH